MIDTLISGSFWYLERAVHQEAVSVLIVEVSRYISCFFELNRVRFLLVSSYELEISSDFIIIIKGP